MAKEKTIISMYPIEREIKKDKSEEDELEEGELKEDKPKDIEYFAVRAINGDWGYKIDDAQRFSASDIEDILKVSKADLVVGITPSQNSFNRVINLPPVDPKRVAEIIKFEAVQQIPFDTNDVYWNWKMLSDPNSALELIVKISAVKRDTVEEYFPFKKMNTVVTVQDVLPYLYQAPKDEKLEAILAIGEENTELVFCKNRENYWNRSIFIGNNYVHKAKKEERQEVMSNFREEIGRSLGFYFSGNPDTKITCLISPNEDKRLITQLGKIKLLEPISHTDGKIELFEGKTILILYRNPYEKFGNTSIKDHEIEFAYASAGALAAENAVNLIGIHKYKIKSKTPRIPLRVKIGRALENFGKSLQDLQE